jgi:ATP-binding cassette subfamily B multidrug efflux pump
MQFSAQDYQKFGVGSLITRTNQDVVQIQMFTNSLMRTTVLTIFMFIMSIVMTMRASLTLSFVILATIPFLSMRSLFLKGFAERKGQDTSEAFVLL